MFFCLLGTFLEFMVQKQQQQHRVSWVGWSNPLFVLSQLELRLSWAVTIYLMFWLIYHLFLFIHSLFSILVTALNSIIKYFIFHARTHLLRMNVQFKTLFPFPKLLLTKSLIVLLIQGLLIQGLTVRNLAEGIE